MHRRRFEFVEGKSSKFWQIEWEGTTCTVIYGRIGTAGRAESTRFANVDETTRHCEKLSARKLKKGYTEVPPVSMPSPSSSSVTSGGAWPSAAVPVRPADDPFIEPATAPTGEPPLDAFRRALELLETPDSALAKFPSTPDDPVWSFAAAVTEGPCAIQTDWRFGASEVLGEVWQLLFPHGIKAMIETEDEETQNPKSIIIQSDGQAFRFRVRFKADQSDRPAHEIFFAVERVLPKELMFFDLKPFYGTDGYGHVLHTRSKWLEVLAVLGPWFWTLFQRHDSPITFKQSGGLIKVKRDRVKKWRKNVEEYIERMRPDILEAEEDIRLILTKRFLDDPERAKRWPREQHESYFASRRRILLVGSRLSQIASVRLSECALRVLDGDQSAWMGFHQALQYHYWDVVFGRALNPGSKMEGIETDPGRLLCLAWGIGELRFVEWITPLMIAEPSKFFGLNFFPLLPYLIQLYGKWKGIEIDLAKIPGAKLGVYRPIFQHWDDPPALAGAIEACCDYHAMRTGGSSIQEFGWPPYEIFPGEILALYRARRMMNLETPEVPHELMDSPLGKLPEPVISPPDGLLQEVLAVVQEELRPTWERSKGVWDL